MQLQCDISLNKQNKEQVTLQSVSIESAASSPDFHLVTAFVALKTFFLNKQTKKKNMNIFLARNLLAKPRARYCFPYFLGFVLVVVDDW